MRILSLIFILLTGLIPLSCRWNADNEKSFLSPTCICYDHNTGKAYVSLSTASRIAVVDLASRQLEKYIKLRFNPGGIAVSNDSQTLFVANKSPDGIVCFISLENGETDTCIDVCHTPDAMALAPDGKLLYVANRFSNSISVIDLEAKALLKHIPVDRDPKAIAISPDGQLLAVANNIPGSAATDSLISAKISFISAKSLELIKNISLANGSQSIEDLTFSKDGKHLYASHILSRNTLPTTQIERGWINSNAVSIINAEDQEYYTTILLDNFNHGAANPAGIEVSENGKSLFVALSGVHEICIIDLPAMHKKLKEAESRIEEIPNDLQFMQDVIRRIPAEGKSPRHICVCSDKVLLSSYFSTGLEVFTDLHNSDESFEISLGNEPEMNRERRGELLFCDADLCFQKWQSCISCHPDARVDGLNWDLLNDGAGNPKNTKSMLYSHVTPPVMITGVRDKAETAVRSGIKYIQFTQYEEADARDIDTYLKSLKPVPSPRLEKGQLTKKAINGKIIFEQAECSKCHSGKYHTDGKKYDVGTGIDQHEKEKFDVPALSEIWRTAPYLYDGRARTMKEVLTIFNPDDKHGVTSSLSEEELECLVEYVMSL